EVRRAAAQSLTGTAAGRKELLTILADEKKDARPRVEALWAIATVPIAVEDFRLMSADRPVELLGAFDDVFANAIALLGTPQFPLKEHTKFMDDTIPVFHRDVPDDVSDERVSQALLAML